MNNLWPSIWGICGSCGSGKTTLLQYLIKKNKKYFDVIFIVSGTAHFTHSFDFLDDEGINYKILQPFNIDVKINTMLDNIEKRVEKKKMLLNVLFIFDDTMGILKSQSRALQRLISMHRHYEITLFFSSQYYAQNPTWLRELFNYLCIFEQRSLNSLKGIYTSYLCYLPYQEFMDKYAGDYPKHSFLYINRVTKEDPQFLKIKL